MMYEFPAWEAIIIVKQLFEIAEMRRFPAQELANFHSKNHCKQQREPKKVRRLLFSCTNSRRIFDLLYRQQTSRAQNNLSNREQKAEYIYVAIWNSSVIIKCIRKLRAERVRLRVKNDNATRVTRPQTPIQIIIFHEAALLLHFGMIPSNGDAQNLIALCKRDWGQRRKYTFRSLCYVYDRIAPQQLFIISLFTHLGPMLQQPNRSNS